jgi:hypothetical protein
LLFSPPLYFLLDQEEFNNANIKKVNNQNCNIQDYWKHKNISYDLNEYHFRTNHNFNALKDNEFILATGCSHTFGLGIDESSRWSNQLEKQLNIPVVNLGVAGSDIQTVIGNVCAYIANFNKPKAIVIQIPELTRYSYLLSNGILQCRSYYWAHSWTHPSGYKLIVTKIDLQGADYHVNQEVAIQQLVLLQTVMASLNIPIVYFITEKIDLEYHGDSDDASPYIVNSDSGIITSDLFPQDSIYNFRKRLENDHDFYKYEKTLMEFARDIDHPGDLQNTVWAEYLVKILKSKI